MRDLYTNESSGVGVVDRGPRPVRRRGRRHFLALTYRFHWLMSPARSTPNIMPDTADHAPSVCSNSTSDAQLNSDTEREATELHDYHGTSSDERVVVDGSTAPSGRSRSRSTTSGSPAIIKIFWARHVVATVPHAACRDHFGTSLSRRCCSSSHHG